jgi:hypothetical protein
MPMRSNGIGPDNKVINFRVGQQLQHVFEVGVDQRLAP